MHRPNRIVTTYEKIYDAILAELVDLNVSTAATHAYNIVTRIKEHDAPKKTSDITGFPEDDDFNHYGRGGITRAAQEMQEIPRRAARTMQRIPRMPGGGARR